ncbi:hypothetical protein [Acetobacter sp. UBA5411]|uniref:hypothetical protein n=1 Tax=Acetobacter sp. UBA5411 TaxID=1945905 RepID=UPI0025C558CC|nr:hypothetical protein [Acetobacter sp. UBA5411]
MATVIDALVVTLGLDPRDLKKGQREAETSLKKVEKSSADVGKSLSHAGETGAQAIRSLSREALSFFAVLTAGKSLKAFVQDNTRTNVALGNLSRNLGVSAQNLGAWQNVAKSFGGTADDVSGSMQSLVSQFQTIDGRRNLGITFGQMGVGLQNANGQLRSMNEMLPDLARAAQRMGPQLFSALGQQAGFSQGFINMLEQGPQKIQALYSALQDYAPKKADTEESGELLADWVKLTAQSEAFGRTIMTSLTPELHDMMQWVSALIDKNQGWIRQDIPTYAKQIGDGIKGIDWRAVGTDVKMFADYLRSIDWQRVGQDVEQFASAADGVAQALGGWQRVTESLFALWAGSKFIRIAATLATMARGAGAIGAVAAAIGAPEIAVAAAGAVGGYEAYKHGGRVRRWFDDNATGASWIDNKLSSYGLGHSYRQQAMADAGTPYKAGGLLSQTGATQAQYDIYTRTVAGIEHARYDQMGGYHNAYAGRYQMSASAIADAAKYLGETTPSRASFLSNPDMQERYFEAYSSLNAQYLTTHNSAYRGASAAQKLAALAYAHNQGMGGASSWLKTGVVGHDGNGTAGTRYSDGVLANLNASRDATRVVSASTSTQPVSNSSSVNANVTINALGGDPHAIKQAVQTAFNDPRFLARQSNRGLQ